jgi:hypothetical protein
MSRADSHDVGGEGSDGGEGEGGRDSHENGVDGKLVGLSFSAMSVPQLEQRQQLEQQTSVQSAYIIKVSEIF